MNGNVLAVDDNPSHLKLLIDILTGAGYRVRPAINGELALKAINLVQPDLILLDIRMPNMDGFEVCRRLKEEKRHRRIPVIFISARNETDDKIKAFQLGGVDYVNKPFEPAEILARVNTHLEQGRLQRQLMANVKDLEAFTNAIHHDLRAPVRAMDGCGQILLEEYGEQLDAESRDLVQCLRESAEDIKQLIDGLLRLSRSSHRRLDRQPVNLAALAEEIIWDLRRLDPERRITFHNTAVPMVSGDRQLLKVALKNLLDNAWKYTANRSGSRIEFGAEAHDDETVFHVRDNGVGFDMTYANQLFVPFKRLHARSQYSGSGIGLATVERIIHRHGGRIWADARENGGATFFFSLAPESYERPETAHPA